MEESVVFPIDYGRELSVVSKEDVLDRGEKEIIIFQGLEDNLVSSRVEDVRVLEVSKRGSL